MTAEAPDTKVKQIMTVMFAVIASHVLSTCVIKIVTEITPFGSIQKNVFSIFASIQAVTKLINLTTSHRNWYD